MAQHIGIIRVKEDGSELQRSQSNFAAINKFLYGVKDFKKKYLILATIDEYGDTSFNHLQLPMLIEELERLKAGENASEGMIADIDNLLDFIKNTKQFEHIKFIGD